MKLSVGERTSVRVPRYGGAISATTVLWCETGVGCGVYLLKKLGVYNNTLYKRRTFWYFCGDAFSQCPC